MQDILAATSDCRNWRSNVKYAAELAAAVQGTLTGIYVSTLPSFAFDIASPALASEIIEIGREQVETALRAEAPFGLWAASLGVRSSAWHVVEGQMLAALQYAANWHDLLVLERGPDAPCTSVEEIGQILLSVGLPCIVVPVGTDVARFGTIAIAWNGSPESVRALHAALPLLRHAQRVVLIRGARHEPISAINWFPAAEIEKYLAWQGLHATQVRIDADNAQAGEAILEAAIQASADLLVMGAYGRTRFSEWFLGGATRHVLEHSRIPLFMQH